MSWDIRTIGNKFAQYTDPSRDNTDWAYAIIMNMGWGSKATLPAVEEMETNIIMYDQYCTPGGRYPNNPPPIDSIKQLPRNWFFA